MEKTMEKVVSIEEVRRNVEGREHIATIVHTKNNKRICFADLGGIKYLILKNGDMLKNIKYSKTELDSYKKQYTSSSSKEVLV